MRVFLSSVRRGLEDERDQASAILRAIGLEVARFEDFGATPAASRSACLDAIANSDVYILILGPHYGDRMPDTGYSATEEEYNAALAAGKPTLVFKKIGVECDDDQAAFIVRVGDYARGRFWQEFDVSATLLPALVTAIQSVQLAPPDVQWHGIDPIEYEAVHSEEGRRTGQQPPFASVLELHVIPLDPVALRSESGGDDLADELMRQLRALRLVTAGAPVERVPDLAGVHVRRPSEPTSDRSRSMGPTSNPYFGIRVANAGTIAVYQALPSDVMGALVSQHDLAERLVKMLEVAIPFIPRDGQRLVVVACLIDEGRTHLGDPALLGVRTSGAMSFGRADIMPSADRTLRREELIGAAHMVALEIAARLCAQLAQRH